MVIRFASLKYEFKLRKSQKHNTTEQIYDDQETHQQARKKAETYGYTAIP
jgi:hypothetical protein